MYPVLLIVLIVLSTGVTRASAQTQSPPASTPSPQKAGVPAQHAGGAGEDEMAAPKPDTSTVSPNAPVITIQGLCATRSTGATTAKVDCKTVITRSEFERLANTLQPSMNAQARKQLANAYPRLLVLEKEAQRRGIEKEPHYVETLKFIKMQLLNQELSRQMQEEASKIPDRELQDYYAKSSRNFEQAAVQRVYVPHSKQEPPKGGTDTMEQPGAERANEGAMATVAAGLRARAAAGEDFDKLEKDAYEAAGIKSNPPSTVIPKIRRVNLPPSHAIIFNLNVGDVSQVIDDPSGYYFYKIQSKTVPSFDELKPEIHATLQNQRMRESVQKLESSVITKLNEAYFTPPSPPANEKPEAAGQESRPDRTEPQQ